MSANVFVTLESEFEQTQPAVFRAWTDPAELAQWRGSPGWHVETETVSGSPTLGGRHRHVKVRDLDPATRVVTDGLYTEFVEHAVFVSSERVVGDPGIDPDVPLQLRVEFEPWGQGTLVRITQGPYEPDVAGWHGDRWEKELARLGDFLERTSRTSVS